MSARAVYRDLLLERGLAQADTPSWLLVLAGPPSHVEAALWRGAREEVFGWLLPEAILDELDARHPRAVVRRLEMRAVAASVALHVEGLHLAQRLGIDPAQVTTLIQPFDDGIADQVTITKVDHVEAERAKVRGTLRQSDTRIPLPNGWQRLQRAGHPFPWHPQPPEGWQISGHRRWLWRRPDPDFEAAEKIATAQAESQEWAGEAP